mmetsp:Transcript_803/g.1429  ORF Transcript_803/g.1429 Transcript_803/m.1429 type:complete len:98 (+) Transcript_803:211-504(+)
MTAFEMFADLLLRRQQRYHTPTVSDISTAAAAAPRAMTNTDISLAPLDQDVDIMPLLARVGACVGLETAVSSVLQIATSPDSTCNSFGENFWLKEPG